MWLNYIVCADALLSSQQLFKQAPDQYKAKDKCLAQRHNALPPISFELVAESYYAKYLYYHPYSNFSLK